MLLHDHSPATANPTVDYDSANEMEPQVPLEYTPPALCNPAPFHVVREESEVHTLLQQQQVLLLRILDNQTIIENKQSSFESRLTELEKKVSTPVDLNDSSEISGTEKRKCVASRSLSVSLHILSPSCQL